MIITFLILILSISDRFYYCNCSYYRYCYYRYDNIIFYLLFFIYFYICWYWWIVRYECHFIRGTWNPCRSRNRIHPFLYAIDDSRSSYFQNFGEVSSRFTVLPPSLRFRLRSHSSFVSAKRATKQQFVTEQDMHCRVIRYTRCYSNVHVQVTSYIWGILGFSYLLFHP